MIRRPCIDCGALVAGRRSRCDTCRLRTPHARRPASPLHRDPAYRRASAQLRRAAAANPWTTCWLCGGLARDNDPWTADHVTPGDPSSDLRPAHRSCNSRRGNGTR